jgi:hypothetical protein
MDMGMLSNYLPLLQQMLAQNRPPVMTPGINPTAQMPQQSLPMGVPFGQMPGLSQIMSQRTPLEIFNSVNPMGTGGLSKYGGNNVTYDKKGNPVSAGSSFLGGLFGRYSGR